MCGILWDKLLNSEKKIFFEGQNGKIVSGEKINFTNVLN